MFVKCGVKMNSRKNPRTCGTILSNCFIYVHLKNFRCKRETVTSNPPASARIFLKLISYTCVIVVVVSTLYIWSCEDNLKKISLKREDIAPLYNRFSFGIPLAFFSSLTSCSSMTGHHHQQQQQ